MLITGFIKTLPAEQVKMIKIANAKLASFLPIINQYHDSIPLKKELNEVRVSYLLSVEKMKRTVKYTDPEDSDKLLEKEEYVDTIVLRQVVLGANTEIKKMVVSRCLSEHDILDKASEIFNEI